MITEILLKVALNAIALTNPKNSVKNQLTIYEESIIMIALSYRKSYQEKTTNLPQITD
jgi:hypothetical protein